MFTYTLTSSLFIAIGSYGTKGTSAKNIGFGMHRCYFCMLSNMSGPKIAVPLPVAVNVVAFGSGCGSLFRFRAYVGFFGLALLVPI